MRRLKIAQNNLALDLQNPPTVMKFQSAYGNFIINQRTSVQHPQHTHQRDHKYTVHRAISSPPTHFPSQSLLSSGFSKVKFPILQASSSRLMMFQREDLQDSESRSLRLFKNALKLTRFPLPKII